MTTERADEFDRTMDQLEAMDPMTFDQITAMVPWQGSPPGSAATELDPYQKDVDGFSMSLGIDGDYNYQGYAALQNRCWQKFNENPFVFTTVTDTTGRLTGYGFEQHSTFSKVEDFMHEVWTDPRNMLILHFGKYIARSVIQGELYLVFTVHPDGFVEVDFVSPSVIKGFDNQSGILTAAGKPLFPLMYRMEGSDGSEKFVPSINLAYYPELWAEVKDNKNVKMGKVVGKSGKKAFKELGGYQTFMVQWDQGFVTTRNVGRAKVALEWVEHYDNIKKWELDHKKSSGAYLWAIKIIDRAAFRLWLSMTDEERNKTGLMAKKTPGGTIMLPPGFELTCINPKLASITNQDDDILKMVSAGLNTPEDVMTGSASGTTYSGTKMSRGPVSDRIQDQVADLERWMIHGFWRGSLWLFHKVTGANWKHKVERAYKFEDGEPKFKKKDVPLHETIEVCFPVSEMGDLEAKAKTYLGVKHGPLTQTLGVANRDVARRLGFQSYHNSRLDAATEEKMYPKLALTEAIEAAESMGSEIALEPKAPANQPANPEPAPKKDPVKKSTD